MSSCHVSSGPHRNTDRLSMLPTVGTRGDGRCLGGVGGRTGVGCRLFPWRLAAVITGVVDIIGDTLNPLLKTNPMVRSPIGGMLSETRQRFLVHRELQTGICRMRKRIRNMAGRTAFGIRQPCFNDRKSTDERHRGKKSMIVQIRRFLKNLLISRGFSAYNRP